MRVVDLIIIKLAIEAGKIGHEVVLVRLVDSAHEISGRSQHVLLIEARSLLSDPRALWVALHWPFEHQEIFHAYIRRDTPQLNGRVEWSHRPDRQEFHERLSYKGDVDL